MSTTPDITVVITTLDRVELLKETLDLLEKHLIYSGTIHYLIGNDGAYQPLLEMINSLEPDVTNRVTIVGNDGVRHGLGGNVNRALKACKTDIVLQTQDDYHLVKRLELDSHVEKLLQDDTAGWIRLRLTAGQNFTATVDGRYWRVSWHSNSLYIASDQPHLKHWRRWHSYYGFYPEGVNIVNTENGWCSQCKTIGQRNERLLDVLIPTDWSSDSSWLHMGDDISLKEKGY